MELRSGMWRREAPKVPLALLQLRYDNENDNRFHLEIHGVATLIEFEAGQVKLTDAKMSEWYRIEAVRGPEAGCQRLLDLGFTPGEDVAVVRSTPLGDPLVVVVRGTQLALRKREASWIQVSHPNGHPAQ